MRGDEIAVDLPEAEAWVLCDQEMDASHCSGVQAAWNIGDEAPSVPRPVSGRCLVISSMPPYLVLLAPAVGVVHPVGPLERQ